MFTHPVQNGPESPPRAIIAYVLPGAHINPSTGVCGEGGSAEGGGGGDGDRGGGGSRGH